MNNPGIQLFVNVCLLLVGLLALQVVLREWDRRAKAKEKAEAEAVKATPKKSVRKKK